MDLAFFGMQGSGKGTQGVQTAERYNLHMFETGGELRRLAKEDSELGRKIKSIIEAGNLVPTEVVMEIVENFMDEHKDAPGILFDGIPRSMEQATAFNNVLEKHGRSLTGVLIEITEEVALKRLLTRRICEGCKAVYPATYDKESCEKCGGRLVTRKDDNEDSIRTRLDTYKNETIPVIEMYQNEDKMISIDGTKSIAEVNNEVQEKLDPLFLNK